MTIKALDIRVPNTFWAVHLSALNASGRTIRMQHLKLVLSAEHVNVKRCLKFSLHLDHSHLPEWAEIKMRAFRTSNEAEPRLIFHSLEATIKSFLNAPFSNLCIGGRSRHYGPGWVRAHQDFCHILPLLSTTAGMRITRGPRRRACSALLDKFKCASARNLQEIGQWAEVWGRKIGADFSLERTLKKSLFGTGCRAALVDSWQMSRRASQAARTRKWPLEAIGRLEAAEDSVKADCATLLNTMYTSNNNAVFGKWRTTFLRFIQFDTRCISSNFAISSTQLPCGRTFLYFMYWRQYWLTCCQRYLMYCSNNAVIFGNRENIAIFDMPRAVLRYSVHRENIAICGRSRNSQHSL